MFVIRFHPKYTDEMARWTLSPNELDKARKSYGLAFVLGIELWSMVGSVIGLAVSLAFLALLLFREIYRRLRR